MGSLAWPAGWAGLVLVESFDRSFVFAFHAWLWRAGACKAGPALSRHTIEGLGFRASTRNPTQTQAANREGIGFGVVHYYNYNYTSVMYTIIRMGNLRNTLAMNPNPKTLNPKNPNP